MKTWKIGGIVMALVILCGAGAAMGAGAFTNWIIHVQKSFSVANTARTGTTTLGTLAAATDVLHLDGIASQTADFIEVDSSSDTVRFKVSADGTITGTRGETLHNIPDGVWTIGGMPKVPAKTSDPCAVYSGTSVNGAMGAIFYNSTNKIMCYCNGNTPSVDLKLDGTSASCF